jgi:hypothetical protein
MAYATAFIRPRGIGAALALSALAACTTAPVKPLPPTPAARDLQQTREHAVDIGPLREVVGAQQRLNRVIAPLLLANADLCKSHARNLLGFTAQNRHSFTAEFADAAHAALGLDERLQVTHVMPGSGAARAGLRNGDRLLMAEDKLLPQGDDAERAARQILGPLAGTRANVRLTVQRGDAELAINVPLTRACSMRAAFGNARNVNSYADGSRILVTAGMLDFVRSDEELAYVLAKEMAHNILGYPERMRLAATLDGIIDNLEKVRPDTTLLLGTGGLKPLPQDLDAAADRLSLYLLVRAGYGIDRADDFWRRLGEHVPVTLLNGHTAGHPATAFRVAALQKAQEEIHAKQAAKKPLVP